MNKEEWLLCPFCQSKTRTVAEPLTNKIKTCWLAALSVFRSK